MDLNPINKPKRKRTVNKAGKYMINSIFYSGRPKDKYFVLLSEVMFSKKWLLI